MSVHYFVPIELIDVELFHWISKHFNLLVAIDEESEDHQSHYNSYSEDHECGYQILGHPIVVEIFVQYLIFGSSWTNI